MQSCGERSRTKPEDSALPSLLHSSPSFRAHTHRECARKAQVVGASPDMPANADARGGFNPRKKCGTSHKKGFVLLRFPLMAA